MKIFAQRAGFVSHPAKDRFAERTVPLGGGIAIFVTLMAFIVPATIVIKFFPGRINSFAQTANIEPVDFLAKVNQLIVILLSAFILLLLGLWDDKKHLGPFFKLAVQFAVAITAALLADVRVEIFIQNKTGIILPLILEEVKKMKND